MRRREFVSLLGGAAAWPVAGMAQPRPAMPVIGFLHGGSQSDSDQWIVAFRQGLREVGFVVGQNVTIEYRFAENQSQRIPALAAELIQRRVAVIAASPNGFAVAPVWPRRLLPRIDVQPMWWG